MKLGATDIQKIYLGATEVTKAYLGSVLVHGSVEPEVIIMTDQTNAAALAVCYAQGWAAHSDYMTKTEAEAVTDIAAYFRDKTAITSFDEFAYFTSISELKANAFRGCTGLTSITLPTSLRYINKDYIFYGDTSLSTLEVPEGVLEIKGNQWIYNSHISKLILPTTVTTMHGNSMTIASNGNNYKCTVILKATAPPTLTSNISYAASINAVYVPDGSVATYQAADKWSAISTKIKKMSDYQG